MDKNNVSENISTDSSRYEGLSVVDLDENPASAVETSTQESWIPGLDFIGFGFTAISSPTPTHTSFSNRSEGSALSLEFISYQSKRRKQLMSDGRFNKMTQAAISSIIVDEFNATKNTK